MAKLFRIGDRVQLVPQSLAVPRSCCLDSSSSSVPSVKQGVIHRLVDGYSHGLTDALVQWDDGTWVWLPAAAHVLTVLQPSSRFGREQGLMRSFVPSHWGAVDGRWEPLKPDPELSKECLRDGDDGWYEVMEDYAYWSGNPDWDR